MRFAETKKSLMTIYDSVEESMEQALEWVGGRECPASRSQRCSTYHTIDRMSFIGRQFWNWGDVQDAVWAHWKEGASQLQKMIDRLSGLDLPEPIDRKRRTRFDEFDGDELDLDRLRAGQPYWRQMKRQKTTGSQTVTIFIDVTTPCRHKSIDALWRGAAGIALAKKLEEHGYRVELWGVQKMHTYTGFAGRDHETHPHQVTATCLKRPQDPLDESTLINATSGWFLRTVIFKNVEANAKRHGREHSMQSTYGYAMDCPTPDELDKVSMDENRIYVSNTWRFEVAAKIVEDELQKFTENQ